MGRGTKLSISQPLVLAWMVFYCKRTDWAARQGPLPYSRPCSDGVTKLLPGWEKADVLLVPWSFTGGLFQYLLLLFSWNIGGNVHIILVLVIITAGFFVFLCISNVWVLGIFNTHFACVLTWCRWPCASVVLLCLLLIPKPSNVVPISPWQPVPSCETGDKEGQIMLIRSQH